jgi:hypothetical protein
MSEREPCYICKAHDAETEILVCHPECATKTLNEARAMAKAMHYIAKRHHAEKWGEANADIAFREAEKECSWLREGELPETGE